MEGRRRADRSGRRRRFATTSSTSARTTGPSRPPIGTPGRSAGAVSSTGRSARPPTRPIGWCTSGAATARIYALEGASGKDAWMHQAGDGVVGLSRGRGRSRARRFRGLLLLRAGRRVRQGAVEVRNRISASTPRLPWPAGRCSSAGRTDTSTRSTSPTARSSGNRSRCARSRRRPWPAMRSSACRRSTAATQAFDVEHRQAALAREPRRLAAVHADPDRRRRVSGHVILASSMRFARTTFHDSPSVIALLLQAPPLSMTESLHAVEQHAVLHGDDVRHRRLPRLSRRMRSGRSRRRWTRSSGSIG